jgi:hypothetical protein
MHQLDNKELVGRLLRSTIGVISRRTSEAYANVIIGNSIRKLSEKYTFLNHIEVKGTQYEEIYDVVVINDDINNVKSELIGRASKEFIQSITDLMGKNAGYYFIREIKEDLPSEFEKKIKNLGVDFDFLQMDFISKIKERFQFEVTNADILKYMISLLFEVLEKESGRDFAYNTLSELVPRLSIEHEVLKYVKINDIRSIQGIDIVTINSDVNTVEPKTVGTSIQKIIQEVNTRLNQKGGFTFIEKLKNYISADYNFKLSQMGVDLHVIKLSQVLVVKRVLKTLIDVLTDSSTQGYAIFLINNIIKKYEEKFQFFKQINIDSLKFSGGVNGINVPSEVDSVRASELGRGIQKIIEDISISMGEDAGKNFVDKLKKRLGKAYVLRIEEIGVNLHMIDLRRNMMF